MGGLDLIIHRLPLCPLPLRSLLPLRRASVDELEHGGADGPEGTGAGGLNYLPQLDKTSRVEAERDALVGAVA